MPAKPSRRTFPTVSIIGPGRLGQALAIALTSSGYRVKALVARRAIKAGKISVLLSTSHRRVDVFSMTQLSKLAPTDLILITTPDDAIEDVARQLEVATSNRSGTKRGIVLHTSGALSSEVLSRLAGVGFHVGSLHPLVSVSEPSTGAKAFGGAFFCVEGDAVAKKLAKRIVTDLGGKSFDIEAQKKPLYHAAALTAAGHLTALIDLAMEMLSACGLDRPTAQKVLMPLVESAVNNLKVSPPEKVLTGTFARGDMETVRRHLEALSGTEQAEALKVYKLLGLRSLGLATGLDPKLVADIRKLIK